MCHSNYSLFLYLCGIIPRHCDAILTSPVKILQILESTVIYHWRSLTNEHREQIRVFLIQKIVAVCAFPHALIFVMHLSKFWSNLQLSTGEDTMEEKNMFLNKLNLILVQILKQDWPDRWPQFLSELLEASKTSEALCENNVNILRLLAEEVSLRPSPFDCDTITDFLFIPALHFQIYEFSLDSITMKKAEYLKQALQAHIHAIFDLIAFILGNSRSLSLINATLSMLQRFVPYLPDELIFNSPLLPELCTKFLPVPAFRVNTLLVLTEVGSTNKPNCEMIYQGLYTEVMGQLVRMVPSHVNVSQTFKKGSSSDQLFIRHLVLFLTGFLKTHSDILECDIFEPILLSGYEYLIKFSNLDDPEIFKIAMEFWASFANRLYLHEKEHRQKSVSAITADPASQNSPLDRVVNRAKESMAIPSQKKLLYKHIAQSVREVLIFNMRKPEEVTLKRDEFNEVVREEVKDTDELAVYELMAEALVYLTNVDPESTANIILSKLALIMKPEDDPESEWSLDNINTLSWAVGSIAGVMSIEQEKTFLVTIIRDLLTLCENKKGKVNKAIVASNIMYVVGQYPRFLQRHWKFLKTVVIKLFEFMHEKHPGIQDMAVDTFLKIAKTCGKKFVVTQENETAPFFDELTNSLSLIIGDLEARQIHTFYKAVGVMIVSDKKKDKPPMIDKLMKLVNDLWQRTLGKVQENVNVLNNIDVLKDLQRVLRTNVAACSSIGADFDCQIKRIYKDMLMLYSILSEKINTQIATGGINEVHSPVVRVMRNVKAEVLNLLSEFFNDFPDSQAFFNHYLPPIITPIFKDYVDSPMQVKEYEVLALMAGIMKDRRLNSGSDCVLVTEHLIEATLPLIQENFTDFPDHRTHFFTLLYNLVHNAFFAVLQLSLRHQQFVMDALIWGLKHTSREIGDLAVSSLSRLLASLTQIDVQTAAPYYLTYLLPIIHETLVVLTDRLHKAHFDEHVRLFCVISRVIDSGRINKPLWEIPYAINSGQAASFIEKLNSNILQPTNKCFVQHFTFNFIAERFPNLNV